MYKIYLILFLILKTVFTSEEEVEKVEKVESEQKVSDVIDLSEGDFDSSIARYDTILVEFYAPWCSVCKSFESQYESAANQLKKNEPSIPLAKV
jgi:thiol:disulfide interchange protein